MKRPAVTLTGLFVLAFAAAWVVLPRFGSRPGAARIAATTSQLATFAEQIAAFKKDTGRLPEGKNALLLLTRESEDLQGWKGPYAREIPLDPWGHAYLYICPGRSNRDSYDLFSAGPDGIAGTADDITNWSTPK